MEDKKKELFEEADKFMAALTLYPRRSTTFTYARRRLITLLTKVYNNGYNDCYRTRTRGERVEPNPGLPLLEKLAALTYQLDQKTIECEGEKAWKELLEDCNKATEEHKKQAPVGECCCAECQLIHAKAKLARYERIEREALAEEPKRGENEGWLPFHIRYEAWGREAAMKLAVAEAKRDAARKDLADLRRPSRRGGGG